MADFTELPVYDGVGDWHFNRYRIAFELPKSITPTMLSAALFAFFPTYINSDYATAQWGDRKYNDRQTVHFHGYAKYLGIDFAQPHSDWVAVVSRDPKGVSFTVQTLKREFIDRKEDGETMLVGGAIETMLVGGAIATHYNRMHFLAGRRAWRIDNGSVFGVSDSIMVLETVAVERFSAKVFNVADSVIGLENKLPKVWLAFLNNFVNLMGLKPVTQALNTRCAQWTQEARARHIERSFANYFSLMLDWEFLDAYRLYTGLLPTK